MSNTIILTRYLYVLDEVFYSLQQSLIDGDSFEECAFWTSELFYSGYDDKLWNLIFEFYYNFCAITHPKYERKLRRIILKYKKEKSIVQILTAMTLLFYTKKNYQVFTNWQLCPSIPNKIYIGRNPKWYNALNIDPKFKNMIRSIHAKNWINVVFYLKYFDASDTYAVIKTYFESIQKHQLKNRCLSDIPYANKQHIVFALIFYLLMDEDKIQKKGIFRSYNHDEYKDSIEKSCQTVTPVYKTLPEKLTYSISDKIGCFPLLRYELKDITLNELYWYHWEYYCYNCPIWKKRFDQYNISVNHDKKSIVFADDDEYEAFSENYYYENDEQTKEVQDRNIRTIPKMSLQAWLERNKLN